MTGVTQFGFGSGGSGLVKLPASLTASADGTSPGTLSASLTLITTGDISRNEGGDVSDAGDWRAPNLTGIGSQYECRLSTVGGSVDSGTVDAWLSLSANRTWTVTVNTVSEFVSVSQTFTGTLEIRSASTGVILTSCPVTIHAQLTSV